MCQHTYQKAAHADICDGELLFLATRLHHLRLLHVSVCRHLSRSAFDTAKQLAARKRGEDALR